MNKGPLYQVGASSTTYGVHVSPEKMLVPAIAIMFYALGQFELFEKHVAHPGIVMLPGVQDAGLDFRTARESRVQGSHLDEVRPRTDDT